MIIRTASDYFHWSAETALVSHEAFIRKHAEAFHQLGEANDPASIQPMNQVAPSKSAVAARINRSRWIVDCPNNDGGAVMAEPGHPMMCPFCGNADIGGKWRPVIWPKDRDLIEATLEARLFARNRNWNGEPVQELVAENASHPEAVRRAA